MDFLDAIILNGLKQTSLASLQGMWFQLSEATLSVSVSNFVHRKLKLTIKKINSKFNLLLCYYE